MNDDRLEVRIYRSLDDLQRIEARWKELLECYPLATTFSTPEWLMSWWRNFGNDQELLVAGFYADSHLVGLAPFSLTPFRVAKIGSLRLQRLMGDGSKDSDNLDLPVKPGFEDIFAETLLHFLESERHSWDFSEFTTMPPNSPGAKALRKVLARRKWVLIEKERPASAIALPPTWEGYLERLSSKERGKIAYYSKRLEKKYQARFYKCESDSDLPVCLDELFHLHQQRWQSAGHPGSFGSAARRQFYLDLGRLLLAQHLLEFWLVDLNGQPAAAQFGFRFRDTVSQLQEGFDRKFSADSVGYVLRARVIQELIAQGVRTYDFLAGIDESKRRWGAEAGHYIDLKFARPFTAGAAYLRGQQYAEQGKSWLRRTLPANVWAILHKVNVTIRRTSPGAIHASDTAEKQPERETAQHPR